MAMNHHLLEDTNVPFFEGDCRHVHVKEQRNGREWKRRGRRDHPCYALVEFLMT